jgi:hypothetical protein
MLNGDTDCVQLDPGSCSMGTFATGHFSREATFQAQLSRSEHSEPVEGRSRRFLRQAQDASARFVEKVSGSETERRNCTKSKAVNSSTIRTKAPHALGLAGNRDVYHWNEDGDAVSYCVSVPSGGVR